MVVDYINVTDAVKNISLKKILEDKNGLVDKIATWNVALVSGIVNNHNIPQCNSRGY
jgi:hypothetical protein